jgi:flagellar biosynthesis/type III secretory pathway ATPase
MTHSFPGELPENVRHLKPAEVVTFQPSNAQIMTLLIEIKASLDHVVAMTLANTTDIEITKQAITRVVDEVTPTLDMLTKGPIGQLLGIGPAPEPRTGRRHR